MSEFQPLIDQLFREEVQKARELGPQGRLRQWLEIAEMNLEMARALGREEMDRRYRIRRLLDERGCYAPAAPQP